MTPSPISSSAVAAKIRSPAGSNPSRASDAIATALAATWSFMSSAPRPQTQPSRSSPDHGSTDHSAGSASTVSVCESSEQARPVAATTDSRHQVRPLGDTRVELALDTERLEVRAQQLGRRGLVPGRVDRVQPDQRLEELDGLVAQAHRRSPGPGCIRG